MIYFKYKEIDHQHFSRDYNGWMLNNQTMPKELVNLFICFYLSVIPSCREYLLVISSKEDMNEKETERDQKQFCLHCKII